MEAAGVYSGLSLVRQPTGVALVNWAATLLVKPRLLPRLDFSSGMAPDSRTVVVVPTMLTSADAVERLVESLEIHYLANRDRYLHFALLTDFSDALQESMPQDESLVRQVRAGVEMLIRKYESDRIDIFICSTARAGGMKRRGVDGLRAQARQAGRIQRAVAGRCERLFSEIVGDVTILPSVRYVITLDTDTLLPRESARMLAGTLAHPLNRPRFDPEKRIVTEGYGILQPRVA